MKSDSLALLMNLDIIMMKQKKMNTMVKFER